MSDADLLHGRVNLIASYSDVIPFLSIIGLRRITRLLHQCIGEIDAAELRAAKWTALNPFEMLNDDISQHILSFSLSSTHRSVCTQFKKLQIKNDRRDWHAKLNYAVEQLTKSSMWYGRLRNCKKVYTLHLLHSRRTTLAEHHHRAPTYPQLEVHSRVLSSQEDVFLYPDADAVVLYDQTDIPLDDRSVHGWANNKCLIGLQRVRMWTPAMISGGYMENVELYSICLDVNQPLHFHGNILLRNCVIYMGYPMFVGAGSVFKMVQCTINRSSKHMHSHHMALKISHNAQCIVLRCNVWNCMDHIFRIYPDSAFDGNTYQVKRCGDQCDSPFKMLECTNNVIHALRGKQAFLGCPPEYCHCINHDYVKKVEENQFVDDGVDGVKLNAIFAGSFKEIQAEVDLVLGYS